MNKITEHACAKIMVWLVSETSVRYFKSRICRKITAWLRRHELQVCYFTSRLRAKVTAWLRRCVLLYWLVELQARYFKKQTLFQGNGVAAPKWTSRAELVTSGADFVPR